MNLEEIRRTTERLKGQYKEFFQSKLPFKQADPTLNEGCCLALCILLAADRFKGVGEAYDKSIDAIDKGENSTFQEVSTIMHRQRQIKRPNGKLRPARETFPEYVDWMEEIARKYGLQLDRGTYRPDGVTAAHIATYVQKKPALYVIGLAGDDGGHALSAGNLGYEIRFFDPNCGLFILKSDVFTEWFLDFLFDSGYEAKYAKFWNAVAFVA